MTISKTLRIVLMLALATACGEPSVPQSPPPAPTVSAVFDPLTGNIPLPNDLALAQIPPTLPAAQQDLLRAFQAQGGFPNDQEVPVTISFQTTTVAQDGTTTNAAPDLDLKSLNPSTLVVFLKTPQGAGTAPLDPVQPADYLKLPDRGTLALHHKGRTPWPPGQYVLALRGGPDGVKTTTGTPVVASPTFFLIAQGEKLDTEQNLALLRAQTGSTAAAKAAAAQLQAIIDQYNASGAFAAVDQAFPHQQAAVMTTFAIAAVAGTQVQLDPGRGLVPLPIDLLRDPRPASASCAACGKLTPLAACTLAQGTLDAQGVCRDSKGNVNGAAAGFATLDGFSTTGFILAPTSDLVVASTVNSTTVKLFDLTDPAHPTLVPATTYITEPAEVTQSGLSPVIALQPAGATAGASPCNPSTNASVFCTRPLKDNTDYAVVVTDGVQDKTGKKLVPGTVAKIVQFTHPTVDAQGNSQLAGIDNGTAFALETMRQKLAPVLNGGAVDKAHVAMAYTFHTETILSTAANLGALPYANAQKSAANAAPGPVNPMPTLTAFSKYGVDATIVHNTNIGEVIETTIKTYNLLDDATGAFNPTGTTKDETINVLIARPDAANPILQPCAGQLAPFARLKCSPMVVFRHGLGSGRAAMLTIADTFNAKGFTVVAIDAEKHGDRSSCSGALTTLTVGGTTVQQCGQIGTPPAPCTTTLPAGAQGDANPPGTCGAAGFFYLPVNRSCLPPGGTCGWTGSAGIPAISSNFLVSANFFRTRDILRQDIIDQSQLVLAIAFAPSGPPPTGNSVFDYMASQGVIIDPTQVSFVGQSLGAIQGTVDMAANPRGSRAVLNVGGGTIVDIFTNSPAFVANTNALLASLGVQPGANSAFLQFLVVAKTILDPADPVNFAAHLSSDTLPNLLGPTFGDPADPTHLPKKAVLTQAAFCDQVVPNPFNFILDSTMGTTPLPPTGAPGTFELYFNTTTGGAPSPAKLAACPSPPTSGAGTPGAVNHAFFTDWVDASATTAGQTNAANFLGGATSPASIIPVP